MQKVFLGNLHGILDTFQNSDSPDDSRWLWLKRFQMTVVEEIPADCGWRDSSWLWLKRFQMTLVEEIPDDCGWRDSSWLWLKRFQLTVVEEIPDDFGWRDSRWLWLKRFQMTLVEAIPDDCGCSEASLFSVITHPDFYHLYSHTAHCSMFVSLSVPRTMTGA